MPLERRQRMNIPGNIDHSALPSIKSLAHHPERVPLAPESISFKETIRQILYGSGNRGTYRILLPMRHGPMQALDPEEANGR